MIHKKPIAIFALIAVIGISFFASLGRGAQSASSINAQETPITIRVADLPVVHALPFYIAMDKGYFTDANITIEYTKLNSPNLIIDALLSKQVDMSSPSGAMGIAGIASFRQPDTLEIYAATGGDGSQRSSGLMVTPDSPITSFADMRGKRMGILPGIQWRTISKHLLLTQGLTVGQDVTLVELAPGLQVSALKTGQIDALFAIEPMAIIAESTGLKEIVHNPNLGAISNPFYPGAGIVRSEFADKHPKAVGRYIEALERAILDIKKDPEEARTHLAGYTALNAKLISIAPIMITKLYKDMSEKDIQSIEAFHEIFTQYGVIDGKIDTRGMIYTPRI